MIYVRNQISLKNYIIFDGSCVRKIIYGFGLNNELEFNDLDGIYKISYDNIHVMTNGVYSNKLYDELSKQFTKAKLLGVKYREDDLLDYILSLRDKEHTHCSKIANISNKNKGDINHYIFVYDKSASIPNYDKDTINFLSLQKLVSGNMNLSNTICLIGQDRNNAISYQDFKNLLLGVSRERWGGEADSLEYTFDNNYIKLYRFFDKGKFCICTKYPLNGEFVLDIMQFIEFDRIENCERSSFDFGDDIILKERD